MKNHLQNIILFLLFGLSCATLCGQTEKPKYNFKMDEVAAEFESELARKKIDTIMQAYYVFDNGRGPNATKLYFWTEKRQNYVKAIKNAKNRGVKEFDSKECPEFTRILDFYFKNIEDIVGSIPEPAILVSHSYGYVINLAINRTEFTTYLRTTRITDNGHCRADWIKMIAEVARPYIEEE